MARKATASSGDESPKKTSESRQFEVLVRLDSRVAEDVKDVARLRKTSMAKYLTELIRPLVKRDLDDELRKRLKENR